MSLILVLGSTDDALVAQVRRRLEEAGADFRLVTEAALFGGTPFALTISRDDPAALVGDGEKRAGFFQPDGEAAAILPLSEIGAVLLRLPRFWWPGPGFDLQDQMFVYHETSSAWFCLLAGLSVPVINRFGLGWWVHDLSYPEQLRRSFVLRLGLPAGSGAAADAAGDPMAAGRVLPTPPSPTATSRHLYLVDDRLLPRTETDAALSDALAPWLTGKTLADWREETGLSFCRLDFETGQDTTTAHLVRVEPFPVLDAEPEALTGCIADGIVACLMGKERP